MSKRVKTGAALIDKRRAVFCFARLCYCHIYLGLQIDPKSGCSEKGTVGSRHCLHWATAPGAQHGQSFCNALWASGKHHTVGGARSVCLGHGGHRAMASSP